MLEKSMVRLFKNWALDLLDYNFLHFHLVDFCWSMQIL